MALHDPHAYPHPDPAAERSSAEPYATFGRYLLFKLLRRDGLGELYRAGEMGSDSVTRMVSLRLFNGGEVDSLRFVEACRARAGVESILRGGAFGEVVDLGREGDVAYVAHELIVGRSLAELFERARSDSHPVSLERTLHIMDRVAIALQNAQERRLGEQRILHGFLTPHFVHISSEGEIHLTGFELSPGLLELPANGGIRTHLAGYISPEVSAGQAPKAADDVYSLGAMFAELLTGEPLPALNPAESSRWVESAHIAAEGEPLPADVKHLLRESLLPRDQRIQKAELWHRALVEITNASDCSPTTFDLAFFVNTLFGDQLERDARDAKAELQAEVPPPEGSKPVPVAPAPPAAPEDQLSETVDAPAEAPVHQPAPLEEPAATAEDGESLFSDPTELEPAPRHATSEARAQAAPSSGPDKRIIAAAAALVVAGLAVAYFVFKPSSATPRAEPLEVASAREIDGSTPETEAFGDDQALALSSVPPPLAPEEIEAQVRSLVAQQAGAMEANLKAEYDQRLVELRQQLESAREAASVDASTLATTPGQSTAETPGQPIAKTPGQPAAETPDPPAVEQPTQATREPLLTLGPPTDAPASQPAQTRERVTEAADQQPPASKPAAPTSTVAEPQRAQTPPARTPARTAETSTPPAKPEPAAVAPGTLVVQGPGVQSPRLTRQPQAVYPPAAARLKREATVKLRVLVDETGKATEVERIGKPVGMGFDQAALKAAKGTRWTPPTKDGVPVKMWVDLSIDFRP